MNKITGSFPGDVNRSRVLVILGMIRWQSDSRMCIIFYQWSGTSSGVIVGHRHNHLLSLLTIDAKTLNTKLSTLDGIFFAWSKPVHFKSLDLFAANATVHKCNGRRIHFIKLHWKGSSWSAEKQHPHTSTASRTQWS